jgi:molybdopterin molybdotransferase
VAFTVEEASEQILAGVEPLGVERIPLAAALGRVLGDDVRAPLDFPPWPNSSMDGYAVRAIDVGSASPSQPVVLPVLETVRAGQHPTRELGPRSAIRVMTGAPIPTGADSVIRVEDTDGGESTVAIRDPRDAGRNVRPRGEDLRAGDIAVARGTTLGPAHLGVLATVGVALAPVHRLPRVAVLASGDELVDIERFDEVMRGERIVSSNSYTLRAAVTAAGGEPAYLGIAPDDPAIYQRQLEGAAGCDLLVTSGGVSVGAFDFTKDVLQALGAQLRLWRVRMRPGAPLGFGTLGAMPWLGLPGNPVSALVTFELFARPLIRRLRGETKLFRRATTVRVRGEITLAAPLTHFMRAELEWTADGPWARLTGPQGSGLLTSMARADALLVIPAERSIVREGESVKALLLGDRAMAATALDV